MATNFVPPQGTIKVVRGFTDVKKADVSTHPRAFPSGSPLWLNKVSGRYQVEPANVNCANAGTDVTAATDVTSSYTALMTSAGADLSANSAFAPLFMGFAAEARISAQLNTLGQFSAGGATTVQAMDASKPFISYYDSGIAQSVPGPTISATGLVTARIEIGTLVACDGFTNENTTKFYDSAGALQGGTSIYLYNNCIATTTNAACAIGIVVEPAIVGQPYILFQFSAAPFNTRLGLV